MDSPRVFRLLAGDALDTKHTPFGEVGTVFRGNGLEAVWVSKQNEEIDPGWFSQPVVDLIVVVRGQLRVEFADASLPPQALSPGDLLVLPANTRCRAYRWPRNASDPAVFFAVYPAT